MTSGGKFNLGFFFAQQVYGSSSWQQVFKALVQGCCGALPKMVYLEYFFLSGSSSGANRSNSSSSSDSSSSSRSSSSSNNISSRNTCGATVLHWQVTNKATFRRVITPLGRIAILKSLILSKLVHFCLLLPVPPDTVIEGLKKMLFLFAFNGMKNVTD